MRFLCHVIVAVALVGATGCGASDADSRVAAPRSEAVSLVLASVKGVDRIEGSGEPVRVSHQPAAVAHGVRDMVVFQGSDSDMDRYPTVPSGPVQLWSSGTISELPTAPAATSVRLLDAGLVNGSPVALVAERFNEGQPEGAAEALVEIDLDDLTRLTVVPRRPAWESSHQAGRMLLDGDVIALHQQETQVHLVRWSAQNASRAWSVAVAEDRAVGLVASTTEVAVVLQTFDERRAFAPTLTLTRHDPVTGEPQEPTILEVDDPDGAIDTGLFCTGWLTASTIACGRSGGAPIAIADDGSFADLGGPSGAMPSVVREP